MAHLHPDNVHELATIATETGAEVIAGRLTYPLDTGGWQVGVVDLGEWLEQWRNRNVVLILAETVTPVQIWTCGACGCRYPAPGLCPLCPPPPGNGRR